MPTVTGMAAFSGNSRRAVALLCVAQFVVVLDVTVVTTALPALGHELGFTPQGLPWVVTAYTLCFGGFLIVGGRVGGPGRQPPRLHRRAGRVHRRVAAVRTGVVGRRADRLPGAAGIGARRCSRRPRWPCSPRVPRRVAGRRRAVGVWTAAAAGGGATGWLLGGLLTEYADWRWVFGINVPVGLAVLPLVTAVLPRVPRQRGGAAGRRRGRRCHRRPGVDRLRADRGTGDHRTPGARLLPLLLGAGLLAVVLRRERRLPDPLLPADLLAVRAVRGANLTAAAVTASTSPAMYLAVLYVQNVLHLPPGRAAVYFPVLNLTVIVGSLLGPRLLAVLTARWTAAGGFALITAGCLVLTTLPAAGLPTGRLLAAFGLMGIGLGLASTASTAVGHRGGARRAPRGRRRAAQRDRADRHRARARARRATGPSAVGSAARRRGRLDGAGGMRWGFAAAGLIAVLGLAGSRLLPTRRPGARDRAGTRAEAAR